MSDDIFDRALDQRNALIKEQRRRIKALEEDLKDRVTAMRLLLDAGGRIYPTSSTNGGVQVQI